MKTFWIILSLVFSIAGAILYYHHPTELVTKIFCFFILVNDVCLISYFITEDEEQSLQIYEGTGND